MLSGNPKIGFIGFGEVAYNFSLGLKEAGIERIAAYDKAATDPACSEIVRRRASGAGVQLVSSLEELIRQSELVFSSVWGNLALKVASEAARHMGPEKMFADLNNSTPAAKKQAGEAVNARGAKFVDVAVFGTPAKERHKVFMCVSGDGAEEFRRVMSGYGMVMDLLPGEAGKATTIKTLAKIYYLGAQALYLELAVSARKAGCDIETLAPLLANPTAGIPRKDELAFWAVRGGIHAKRKTAELQDYVPAIREWGVEPIMMEAALERLELTARYQLHEHFKGELPPLSELETMIEAMEKIGAEKNIGLK